MPSYRPQIITRRQAKKQINTLGTSLIIYILLTELLWYGSSLLQQSHPGIFLGYDPELVTMLFTMIMWIIIATIPFSISASRLDLDLKDYLGKPKMSVAKQISLTCVGVGIMLAVTAIPSLFYMLVHTSSVPYEFVGVFTTKNNILKNVVYFILMVLVKPVCDEIIFRGIIQRQLGHYGRYFGVLASAFLYMISRPTLTEAIPSFFLGWYLALITLRFHSIRPAIKIHIFISFFDWLINITPQSLVLIPTVMIVIIYIIAGFSLFNGTVNLGIARSGASNRKLWKILMTSPTIIICIILFLAGVGLSFTPM